MNTVKQIYKEYKDIDEFTKGYLSRLADILEGLDIGQIKSFAEVLDRAREEARTIFIAGNGGSAATALHMANDLGTDTLKYSGGKSAFRALSLTDNTAIMLAVANDDGYENIFVNQLRVHYRKGDVFVGISASGNSSNVVKAARWVKENGGKVLAMVGFDGGELKRLADEAIHVRSDKGEYGIVEDTHMIMDHLIANWFQRKILQE